MSSQATSRLTAHSPPHRIAITAGDPLGIGPEIALKALAELTQSHPVLAAHCTVVGPADWLAREARRLALPLPGIDGLDPATSRLANLATMPRKSCAPGGEIAYQQIVHAVSGVQAGRYGAVVTAPISKEALHLAGHIYPGHTELLAELAGGVPVRMMLMNDELRTVLVTVHLPLRQALDAITPELVLQTIQITHAAGLGPRIAVAGINPHAGENGLLGDDEARLLQPAIDAARAQGLNVSDPIAPDTVFMRARGFKEFDVVIAMYHDQGLIPVKYLGLDAGVNVTLGLPFVRTSPDHGTAFDIAGQVDAQGQGLANPLSMLSALHQAAALLG
jgi:4-hydroxythreonine-4-phosphate dehydrogenase